MEDKIIKVDTLKKESLSSGFVQILGIDSHNRLCPTTKALSLAELASFKEVITHEGIRNWLVSRLTELDLDVVLDCSAIFSSEEADYVFDWSIEEAGAKYKKCFFEALDRLDEDD